MTRLRHRWSEPDRQSSELTIRTCEKCWLVCESHHDWQTSKHWKMYRKPGAAEGDVTLVMPECEE